MSICHRCHNLSFHIDISIDDKKNTHAKYIDECPHYPHMVGKVKFKEECPHFEQRWEDDDNEEPDDDETLQ